MCKVLNIYDMCVVQSCFCMGGLANHVSSVPVNVVRSSGTISSCIYVY